MGANRLKMVAPSLKKSIRGSVYPFSHLWHGHTAPISTNGHRLGKSLRLPQNIFGAGRQLRAEARSGRFTI